MSSLPPPSFDAPPPPEGGSGQPASGQAGLGPAAFGQPGPSASTPPSRSSKRLPLMIAAGVALVAVLVIAAVVLFGGDDDPAGLDTAKASDRVAAVIDDAQPSTDNDSTSIDDCTAGDLEKIGESIPDEFDTSDIKGETETEVVFVSLRDPAQIQCHIGDDVAYGVVVSESPADLESYLAEFLGDQLDFEKGSALRGGEVLSVCSTDRSSPDACATAWADSRLMVVMVVSGDGASTKVTTEWLKSELTGVIDTLAAASKT